MKNFTLLILFLSGFLFNGLAAPGWRMLNPYPQANQLNDVFVFNDSTAIAVGESQVVIKTTNGGVNWDVISNAGGGFHELKALDFISTEIGWAVGEYSTVLKTTDGGKKWLKLPISLTAELLRDVSFISELTGWAVSSHKIFKTNDGGMTWTYKELGTNIELIAIQFVDDSNGWVVGWDGVIYATTNGGLNWNPQNSGTIENLLSFCFVNDSVGYAVGNEGTIIKTINGGINWYSQSIVSLGSLVSVYFKNNLEGFIIGWDQEETWTFLRTNDGGNNWISQPDPDLYYDLLSIGFSGNTGWMVGDYGRILKSTNNGVN